MNKLQSQLESILFVSNKPLSINQLAKATNENESDIRTALGELLNSLKDNGIVLLEANGQFQLATHSQNSDMVKNFLNADLREKLTEATVEVLAIIAYRQPIAKSEIEAIRGVNSQYSIRHLLMRGLIEKISNPDDGRSNYYQVTTEFMQQLGLTSMADLPDFETLVSKISLPQTPALSDENKTAPGENPSAVSEI